MFDKDKFNDILDSCLSRLLAGISIEECLKDYTEQADTLRPLLETAAATKEALGFQSRLGFKNETRRQLLTTLAGMKAKAHSGSSWLDIFRARWVAVGVSVALAIVMSGGGLVAASGDSLPGDFLYSFKLAGEQVLLSFSFGDEARAETYARLAGRRVEEIVQLAAKKDVSNIEETTMRLDGYLASITEILSPSFDFAADNAAGDGAIQPEFPESDQRDGEILLTSEPVASDFELLLQQYGLQQVAALEQALETSPQETKSALEQALAVTLAGYQDILNAVD